MKKVMILVTAILLVIGSSLNAQPRSGNGNMRMQQGQGAGFNNGGNGFGERRGSRFERMQAMLNLTDEQTTKISDLRFAHETLALDTRSEIQKNRLLVRKMMTDNEVDQEKLLKITKENSKLQEKIKLSRTNMWLEVYNMLDEVQKEKWTNSFGQFGKDGNERNFHKQGKRGFGNNDCGRGAPQRRMR